MATLKTCPDCGYKVSPKATSCPRCGRPNPAGVSPAYLAAQILVSVGGVVIVLGMIGSALNPRNGLANDPQLLQMSEAAKAAAEAFGVQE